MGAEQSGIPFPFIMLAIFAIFYFLVIMPEKKKQKEMQDMRSNLKKNDRVITTGGIYGTVVLVKDDIVTVRVDDNTKIDFDKQCVSLVGEKKQTSSTNCACK